MITEKKAANAMAGKTARACDSCLRKRARWFCAADDAFLCQACDASVHCANQLASRHQRVRLQTSSFKDNNRDGDSPPPAWQRGVTRKARTPRHKAKQAKDQGENSNLEKQLPVVPLVPEMSNEDDDKSLSYDHENELNDQEQLLYRVPVFDPFAAELCHPMVADDDHQITAELTVADHEEYGEGGSNNVTDHHRHHHHHHHHEVLGFLPSELELAEFAADVESLLGGGGGLEEEYSCDHEVKGFGIMELLDCKEEEEDIAKARVKVEEEDHAMLMEAGIGGGGEKFDYDGLLSVREGEEEGKVVINNQMEEDQKKMVKRDILLRLNYEAVIAAWASQGSPWTTGTRPEVNLDHGWPDYMDLCRTDNGHNPYGDHLRVGGSDVAGREARVSRYREKRRTRLFSKKIRYEVRKLNAEKRPRMKGRFVKRTSFMSTNSTTFHYSNQLIIKNNT